MQMKARILSFFTDRQPRVGIALSGGGARGFAHAGALKAMEEMGIRPDVIAGVSAGSVVAVMYAAGLRPQEILEAFTDASFTGFAELGVPKAGFFKMDGFKKFLRRTIPYENLEDLPVPVYIGATDIDHGVPAVFSKGNIADCVAASCSIPIVFQPQKIHDIHYVDGGVLHNLPSWVIRDKCRYLFGVNVSPVPHRHFRNNILGISQQLYNILVKNNVAQDLALCDLAIEMTEIASYKVFNLKGIRSVYNSGYRAARQRLAEAGFRPVHN